MFRQHLNKTIKQCIFIRCYDTYKGEVCMSLYERNYMRQNSGGSENPRRAIWVLIFINAVLFIFASGHTTDQALYCDGNFRFYQLLTAGFVHSGFGHIFFNMYGLFLFGSLVAPHIGEIKFYILYLIGVLSGNLLFMAFNYPSNHVVVGASGAVFAVMMGAAMLEPDRRFTILFFPFIPLKTSTLVICYTVLEILSAGNVNSGVAHLAHLGGFLGGYIYLKIAASRLLAWDPLRKLQGGFKRPVAPKADKSFTFDSTRPVSPDELDYLLNKLSIHGINSLTPQEYDRLRQAREEMRK